ncbi:MAG: tRNA threonylcarbamoyladenosine dehydratase [Paludibacteraceae bacterium]|nr:tRNA threonylcarbamoyladenosine dehydratase [Paludibacteraceae bacterium]MBP6284182.1 tRNA threonylcarbamoyladenosine dehydratase [Paludibacteraceae bacterium]
MWTSRTALLIGQDNLSALRTKHVLIVGVGGVGAYAAEMLCRAGIGSLTLVDADTIKESNINRQLPATSSTVGEKKAQVLANRFTDINPDITLHCKDIFIEEANISDLFATETYDFVVDAIDTLAPKIALIQYCITHDMQIISSMGAGGRMDPTQIQYADISETDFCKLAKFVRKRLRKIGIERGLPVVFSTEQVNKESVIQVDDEKNKCSTVGTISYLPAIFGCYLSAYVIQKIIQK